MQPLWRSINRDLWPRRYTAWFTAVVVGWFALFRTFQVILSRSTAPVGQSLWLTFFWCVALSSLIEATTGIFSNARRRRYIKRREAGLCGQCGDDLRAATSITCPECGAWHGTTPTKRFGRAAGGS